MGVTSALSMSASVLQTKAPDLTAAEDSLAFRRAVQLIDGTTAGKADRVFHDRRTLATSVSEDLDLAGFLQDGFGQALTFVRVENLFAAAAAANTNNVVLGNAASNAWAALLGAAGTVTLRPGACLGVMAGDLLKVANSTGGTGVTYDVVIVGTSA
ncbi:hypothetical protein [Streptomyces flavofungini]|uniref:hypothetical protein n=1 Tax=Streptomyces flavofungini TaxID=68200 RepID=UPI0025B0265A|nr:hypothetical protein [Streptomyces flavofungini]WJV47518.1 hypothetical protein QUY26_19490 [Streptomyces flavofungini]